jgi:hypothetical protein
MKLIGSTFVAETIREKFSFIQWESADSQLIALGLRPEGSVGTGPDGRPCQRLRRAGLNLEQWEALSESDIPLTFLRFERGENPEFNGPPVFALPDGSEWCDRTKYVSACSLNIPPF